MFISEGSRSILGGVGGEGEGVDKPKGRNFRNPKGPRNCNSTETMGKRNRAHFGKDGKIGEGEDSSSAMEAREMN